MFDLSKSLSDWKKSLKNEESFTKENIEELENHLKDQISELMNAGLNEEESFLIAKKRIGRPSDLSQEYHKTNTIEINKKRILWMLTGVIVMNIINGLLNSLNSASYAIAIYLDINLVTWTYIAYGLQILALVSIFTSLSWAISKNNQNNIINRITFKLKSLKLINVRIFILLCVSLNLMLVFLSRYGLQWINTWQKYYVETDIYRHHLEIIRILNPAIWYLITFTIIIVFALAYKHTYSKETLST